MECVLPMEALAEFAAGAIRSDMAATIETHLDGGCTQCTDRLTWLRRISPVLHAAITSPDVGASNRALRRAFSLASGSVQGGLRLVHIAKLLLDGRPHAAPVGVRGQLHRAFQLVFETEDEYVELWQERVRQGQWCVIGTVLSKTDSSSLPMTSAALTSTTGSSVSLDMSDKEFHVPAAPTGTYHLSLRMGRREIVVPEMPVGA